MRVAQKTVMKGKTSMADKPLSKKPAKAKVAKGSAIFSKKDIPFYIFASPWIIGMIVFFVYPAIMSFYYSMTDYNIVAKPVFIGMKNYVVLFTKDGIFMKSILNTLFMVAFSLPLQLLFQLVLAFMLNWEVKGIGIFRTIYYIPVLVPPVSTSLLFTMVYDDNYGILNAILRFLHLPAQQWLTSTQLSKPSIIILGLWTAGSGMLFYLSSLKNVPSSLYESANIDGASAWRKTWNITIPIITPTIFFQLIMGVIATFQLFTESYVLTKGGPAYSSTFMMYDLYTTAFKYGNMGRASAMAWILFLIILVFSVIILRTSGKWVYYEEEAR